MNDPIHVTWIDDQFAESDPNNSRVKIVKEIDSAGESQLKIERVASTTEDFSHWLSSLNDQVTTLPDILILDFRLTRHPDIYSSVSLDNGYKIREALDPTPLRHVPKYLVSIVLDANNGPDDAGFDWILGDPSDAERVAKQLIDDGQDYRKLKGLVQESGLSNSCSSEIDDKANLLIKHLETPLSIHEELGEIVAYAIDQACHFAHRQEELKISGESGSVDAIAMHLSRWIRNKLLVRNGPLIDALSVANLLGADQDYFSKELADRINSEHPSALYQGLFRNPNSCRWWRDDILEWIYEIHPTIVSGPVSRIAPQVAEKLNIPDESRSRCAVCNDLWPDVVACDSEDTTEYRQVHRRCSAIVEYQTFSPGLNELRTFEAK